MTSCLSLCGVLENWKMGDSLYSLEWMLSSCRMQYAYILYGFIGTETSDVPLADLCVGPYCNFHADKSSQNYSSA